MVFDFEFEQFTHHALDLMDPGVAEFDHFATLNADNMVMLLISIAFFKLGRVFAKLVLGDQVTGDQQLQGIINSRPADPVILIFHMEIQGFHIEMVVSGIYLFQDRIAFRGFSEIFILKVSLKNFLDSSVVLSLRHATKIHLWNSNHNNKINCCWGQIGSRP